MHARTLSQGLGKAWLMMLQTGLHDHLTGNLANSASNMAGSRAGQHMVPET